MAHYAEIDADNNVLRVIVIDNNVDQEDEAKGIAECRRLCGENTNWLKASYNGNLRKNYPSTGFKYDPVRDAFIPPKDFPSWVLNEEHCRWFPPVPYPEEGRWAWDEDTTSWVAI